MLDAAEAEGIPTGAAADRFAEGRIARLRHVHQIRTFGPRGVAVAKVFDEELAARNPLPDRHTELGLSGDDVVAMYRTTLLARTLDQRMWNLNRQGRARFVISGQGQEGTQVGSAWALRAGYDIALPYYRDFGVVLTLGMTPYEVFLAVLARADDPNSGGRQMPNHWGCRRLNIITGSSPIATQLPHAAGLAQASAIRGDDRVTVCWFGEAASSKGDFHEALNYAGIHRLPVVFVCENNHYAISVTMAQQSAVADVAARASSYGMPGVIVDGNDTLDVYGAVRAAVARARAGRRARRWWSARPTGSCPTRPTTTTAATAVRRRCRSGGSATRCPACAATWSGRGLLTAEAAEAMEVGGRGSRSTRPPAGRRRRPRPTPETAYRRVYARPLRPHARRARRARRGAGPPARSAPPRPADGRGAHRARHRPPDAPRPDGRGRAGGRAGRGRGRAGRGVPGHRRAVRRLRRRSG